MTAVDANVFQDVFVYDIEKDTTIIVSISTEGKSGDGDSPIGQGEKVAISFDGNWVAFSTKATNLGVPAANIVMRNMTTGKNKIVSSVVGSNVGRPSISQTGSYVVFGIGGQIDGRFPSTGIFANFTGIGPCRFCPE
jgi:Tol biopolymer transport system component